MRTSNPKRLPPHVNEFRDPRGKLRRYFRRPGQKKAIALPADCDVVSPEFMAAYLAALGEQTPKERGPRGIVSALIASYYNTTQFRGLADNTKRTRRSYLERFRGNFGAEKITKLEPKHIRALLDRLSPAVRKGYLEAIRTLMQYAVQNGHCKDDPTASITRVTVRSEKIHPWTDAENAQYKATHPLGTMPRLAWALLFYTAQRLGDAIKLGPSHVVDGMIYLDKQQKTGAEVWIVIHPELAEAIAAMKVIGTKTWLVNERGGQFADGAFGNSFRKWCNAAGLRQCSAHGLRHAGLTWYAENGATAPEIQGRGGHKTLAQAQHYVELANKKKLARSGGAKVAGTRAGGERC
jgi:integrase